MSELKKISKIKKENLDERNYCRSLLEEASYYKMLTEDEILAIQIQIMELLEEKVASYIGYENSSIRKEKMEDILESIFYTISIDLKSFEVPDDAIKELKENKVKTVYQEGRKKIYSMLKVIKIMYEGIKRNKLNVANDTYQDTILGGIQGFLKIYDPELKAQDMKITADYPLYNNLIGKLDGIEFIKEYINSIYLENSFCQKFSEERIKNLLYGYLGNYQEAIINIFEIVFLETIACKLVNRDLEDLIISKAELSEIYEKFKNKEAVEIENMILNAYNAIKKDILGGEIELQKYIEKNLNGMLKMVINAFEMNTLDKIFITQKIIF